MELHVFISELTAADKTEIMEKQGSGKREVKTRILSLASESADREYSLFVLRKRGIRIR